MNESLIKNHGLTEVIVLDEEGKSHGVHKVQDALVNAKKLKLDLILLDVSVILLSLMPSRKINHQP